MKSKKDIKARELAIFCDCLDEALEKAISNFLDDSKNFDTEAGKAAYDAILIAWDSAFNFTAFDSFIRRNFLRGFEAAWQAFEKAKREKPQG